MLVYISGTLISAMSSGISSIDGAADQWKENVEDWAQYILGLPKHAWDAGALRDDDGGNGAMQYFADSITQMLGEFAHTVGIFLLQMAPSIMLVVCMGSILGAMIGSSRCRHWAGVAALASLILKVVNVYVGV